ncbi:Predicted O-methyltransferase YrrM [Haloarcula vallismortis]|uniref:Caffeoyl-CoA O-methyltransferase/O-methyltransferase family 3 n=2 Tax=Haloarcula vallismortis TaxID=28442 RepID=M0JMC9_HALVA|nr:O-methyltransferase [Haloarcula vallismortis]EMA09129.1 caffeoyl-CoA O-methyltransferase/O-methyltransferase family 3 [Haloarcula vallismortis ATCC 29715]SDX20436.1 Predicted O-methyltransferase YrrM [Haloarcula vallismortis]
MDEIPLPEVTEQFARTLAPPSDAIIEEMDAKADREGFPTVGPAVGGWLRLVARMVDADRVFEFGSGFGYSAYWMAPAVPEDGQIVLTEVDANELAEAREFLDRGGFTDRAAFEHGDAIEIVERYDGAFDVVLIDNEKHRYAEAFEAVREKVPVGGAVVADNMIEAGPLDFEAVQALLDGEDIDANETSRGIAAYLECVGNDSAFETGLLPLGEGVAVSVRVE